MYSLKQIEKINSSIAEFPIIHPIVIPVMHRHQDGVSRLVMLDRYSYKDIMKVTLAIGDIVVAKIKDDPKFPAIGIAEVLNLFGDSVEILVEEEFRGPLEGKAAETGILNLSLHDIEKPLELFYEQIALRNATGLAAVEPTKEKQDYWFQEFYNILSNQDFVPAGRVLYGAGAETDVTLFNCYVMPYPKDSREGISEHRGKVMEIMSRGGGVGTNGSTLRPRNTLARGVNGKSSGAISWLDDIARLTHLVSQGGSRRGAQMIMLMSSHPDIFEFIISKMQNPKILQFIIDNVPDDQIKKLAQEKLKFTPLRDDERNALECVVNCIDGDLSEGYKVNQKGFDAQDYAENLLTDGGRYSVENPEFLTGANISVALTHDFMHAVENDLDYDLVFPDVENYNKEQMTYYNENWHECGDVRLWESEHNMPVRTYRTIRAKYLWDLINICATYAAEPGIFFLDNSNDMTNAKAYGQQVVATNPCGEQPLAPFSVCNLAAVNLANMKKRNLETGKWEIDYDKLIHTIKVGVRMQDNIINSTPYFMEENKIQGLGERRVGLGVMGLHDLQIYTETIYGSPKGNEMVDSIFETISHTAYLTSIDLAKEKGSFPFLETFEDGRECFINTGYMKKMPEHIRNEILVHGIRNSHLLTVAPTGSTGTLVGCSTGLEPYYSFSYFRSGRLGKFIEVNAKIVQEYLDEHPEADKDNLPPWFISAMDLSPEAHVDVQCIIQKHVDSSLSKTVNAPKGYSVNQVQEVYERLWHGGAKGGTVYVDGSRDAQVLSLTAEENDFKDTDAPAREKQKVYVVETIKPLEDTNVVGSEIGQTCPMCRKGTVVDRGGCAECDNCGIQLRCGL